MIKKRKYKKRKRNPKHVDDKLICYLEEAVQDGNIYSLENAFIYYNQGKKCEDCENLSYNCSCEKCEDCEYNRCMCDLGFSLTDWVKSDKETNIYRKRVQQKAIEFAKEILTKEQLKEVLK